ncbi:hypothetical protein PVAG01_10484 [Phlyctema vagabunda]|uniref:Uncharacterized protein n=1 Tax=Phlyctema vagabunda TaxID=108571 RepID=A0ABR4P631_9HELO
MRELHKQRISFQRVRRLGCSPETNTYLGMNFLFREFRLEFDDRFSPI